MIFLIKPITSIVQNLSNENELLVFLGLKSVTNSVNEFGLFYKKFLYKDTSTPCTFTLSGPKILVS